MAIENKISFPFKGIVECKPYSQSWLPPDRRTYPVIEKYPSDLWLTQPILIIRGLFGDPFSLDKYPHVVYWDGEYFLEDGHHRLVKHVLSNGDALIEVRELLCIRRA